MLTHNFHHIVNCISTKSQLRGAPPIDYQLRNRQRIKEMQKQHQRELQINKEKEIHNQILAQKKSNRFKSIPSRVHTAVCILTFD